MYTKGLSSMAKPSGARSILANKAGEVGTLRGPTSFSVSGAPKFDQSSLQRKSVPLASVRNVIVMPYSALPVRV